MAMILGEDLSADERRMLDSIVHSNDQRTGNSLVQSLIHKGYVAAAAGGPALTDKGRRTLKPSATRTRKSAA